MSATTTTTPLSERAQRLQRYLERYRDYAGVEKYLKENFCNDELAGLPEAWDELQKSAAASTEVERVNQVVERVAVDFERIARAAIARGENRVLPIEVGGKNPAIYWVNVLPPGNDINTMDSEQWAGRVESWVTDLAQRFPNLNACVVAKPFEFIFIDCDTYREFVAGYEAFAGEPFPVTYTTSARENRTQIHFRQTDATRVLGNVAQFAVDGVDLSVRQRNEYVLAEGSQHKNGVDVYKRIVDSAIVPMPDKMVDYIQRLRRVASGVSDKTDSASAERPETQQSQNWKNIDVNALPRDSQGKVTHGHIHQYMLAKAGALRAKGKEQDEIEELLLADVHANCAAPIDDSKVEAMAKSICLYEKGQDYSLVLNTAPNLSATAANTAESEAARERATAEAAQAQEDQRAAQAASSKEMLDSWLKEQDPITLSVEQALNNTALLTDIDYETLRSGILKKLGWKRPATLDTERDKRKPKTVEEEDDLQGQAVVIEEIAPWTEPVNTVELLNEIESTFRRFMFFWREDDAITAALWTVMTWFADGLNTAPYLGIRSPEKECGKTTLLTIIRYLAYHTVPFSNVTSAAAFRLLDMHTLTLLVDELDTFLRIDPAFLNIMNSGHSREMGKVARCVGDDQEVRDFKTFGPKAYGMIGSATDTMESRSLPIILYPAVAEDNLEPLDFEDYPEQKQQLQLLARKIARWVQDNRATVLAIKPNMKGATNRGRDNWRPLFRIAEFAGGEWLQKARRAAGLKDPTETKSVNRQFIEDVRNIFYTRNASFIPSNVLLADLRVQEESGWAQYGKGGDGMTQMDLANLMKAYGIKPERGWLDGARSRGYHVNQFAPAFKRFLAKFEPEVVSLGGLSTPELQAAKDKGPAGTGTASAGGSAAGNSVSFRVPDPEPETVNRGRVN